MERADVVTLLTETPSMDSMGQIITTTERRECFCTVRSVSSSEWFAGGQAGFQPEWQLRIVEGEYNGEKECEFLGKKFAIYRTYRAQNDILELYLTSKVGVTHG